jgi:cobalamin synthase
MAALAGALVATTTHAAKAGTRAVANTSPEPFSNWALSFAEDGFVIAVGLLALSHPFAATIVVVAALAVIVFVVSWLVRRFRSMSRVHA